MARHRCSYLGEQGDFKPDSNLPDFSFSDFTNLGSLAGAGFVVGGIVMKNSYYSSAFKIGDFPYPNMPYS